ncbi:MAG TPA: NAD(P)H-hydrate dehydratase [Halobacteria archaeon]|jgi:NAD(P)H-hydrate epimerase|nr:NAD(P)H-hydrate dehydratase [Halobacteria archaeon]
MKVSTVAQMRNLDRTASERFGLSEDILMENAGYSVFSFIRKKIGLNDKKFLIFAGTGNNGGDGLVIGRKIFAEGGHIKIFIIGDKERLKGAAKKNYDILLNMGADVEEIVEAINLIEKIRKEIIHADLIIDSIFGTGITREVTGVHKEIIRLINSIGKSVLSVDIPSGINGDTGIVMGDAVRADYTITLGTPKIGNLLYPGFNYSGKLFLSHISFPSSLYDSDELYIAINSPIPLPSRENDSHKGSFGKVLFVAGSSKYLGAPYFSSLSFLKSGGGLSYLATPKSISSLIANKGSEIVVLPQKETKDGCLSLKCAEELINFSKNVDMAVIGPGLSLNKETKRLVIELVREIEKPVLIDGDGITAVSEEIGILKDRKETTIITPHLGEMTRLTDINKEEISKDKINVLKKTTEELNSIIVLKGAHSLVGYTDGRVYINTNGNPGMATAGSGDVLTGTIPAMFGLGLDIKDAVRIGVYIHGLSGDIAAENKGMDGITATDIMEHLPDAMRYYRDNLDELKKIYEIEII